MRRITYKGLLFFSLLFFIIAVFLEVNLSSFSISDSHYKGFERALHFKIEKADKLLQQISDEQSLTSDRYFNKYSKLFLDRGIALIVYNEDSLCFWPNNSVPTQCDTVVSDNYLLIKSNNAFFLSRVCKVGQLYYRALILIKYDYKYENRFLKNKFQNSLWLPNDFSILFHHQEHAIKIKNKEGEYLFSLKKGALDDFRQRTIVVSALFYSVGIIFALVLIVSFIKNISNLQRRHLYVFIFPLVLLLLKFLMEKVKFPYVFYQLELFSPFHYAFSYLLPSIGDLLFLSVFIFSSSLLFYKAISPDNFTVKSRKVVALVFAVITLLYCFFYHPIFTSLIYNSKVLLNINEVYNLSVSLVVGILPISLLSAGFVLILIKTLQLLITVYKLVRVFFLSVIVFLVIMGIYIWMGKTHVVLSIAALFVVFYMCFRKFQKGLKPDYRFFLNLIVIISLYSVSFVVYHSLYKEEKIREVLVVNLANERDAVAEMLLESYESKLTQDKVILDYLSQEYLDDALLYDYLLKKYFSGFWGSFELQVIPCGSDDSMFVENTADTVHCRSFFDAMTEKYGVSLSKQSKFYFLDNMNGRISYLGKLLYDLPDNRQKTLYISLDSKLVTEVLGYPELLIDEKKKPVSPLDSYSYAKYKEGRLETQKGEFAYSLVWNFAGAINEDFTYIQWNGYQHLIHKVGKEDFIVISRPRMHWLEVVVSFSYLFVAFYFFMAFLTLTVEQPSNVFRPNFNFRIRFSMVIILILSFVLVGIGSTYFTIRQFERKHHENIKEKIQSVKIEIEHKIGFEEKLDKEIVDYLESLLKRFSQVFFTDINVYDLKGRLLASSLPEIFNEGFISRQMAPKAYDEMVINQRALFINKEKVGNMGYYSIYIPFYNYNDVPIAYLNLPYFTKQSELQKELVATVFTIINIYIILIVITLIVAVFMSNKVTRPLQLVQEKIKKINLKESNELIDYESGDEIGSLVKEYNKKVLELVDSAKKLAASERESAWREMARQIAHEIKNPLTPMKLSIQHLQRAFHHKVPNLEEKVDKVSLTLIEQINNLSTIANEFSNYAKMPEVKNEKVDIISKIGIVEELFSNTRNVSIQVKLPKSGQVFVFADDKQITRVFINLVKNSIQSVPKEKMAEIGISVKTKKNIAVIEVRDNGSGIEDEVRLRLFQPNFTTKSSGMGMGLAIVKNIVESSNGKIYYTTELGKGTSFFVELFLYK